jgi:3-dehydroquinate dehydratase
MKTAMQELLEWVRATLPMDLDTPQMIERKIESMLEKDKDVIEDIIDIIDSENSGQSAEQRLDSIKEYLLTFNTKEK